MKQTAVDYLIEQIQIALKMHKIEITPQYLFRTVSPVFTKAKQIEKEQIIQSYCDGFNKSGEGWNGEYGLQDIKNIAEEINAEQYYNETYQPKPI